MKKALIASGVVAAGVLLSSCAERAVPTEVSAVDDAAAGVVSFPSGFAHVAAKCVGPDKVFVSSEYTEHRSPVGSAVFVVPQHPECKED